MADERTLLILKPDALERRLEYEILSRVSLGLAIPVLYKTTAPESMLREHYSDVLAEIDAAAGEGLIRYMSRGPIIVSVVAGSGAIATVRSRCGEDTEPSKCRPGTIRWDYSRDSFELAEREGRCLCNLVHSSDSAETAKREMKLWFERILVYASPFRF